MDPQVIADTALYLNSDLAAKVTGVTIPVDAGHLILTGVNASPRAVTAPGGAGFLAARHARAQCRRCACRAGHRATVPRPKDGRPGH
jgi:hypothetical protein